MQETAKPPGVTGRGCTPCRCVCAQRVLTYTEVVLILQEDTADLNTGCACFREESVARHQPSQESKPGEEEGRGGAESLRPTRVAVDVCERMQR
eukprot:1481998-Rhodomonas_salina.1